MVLMNTTACLYSFIQSGWHRIIHDALYKDVPAEDALRAKDPIPSRIP
jgi:hypothetical protein